jgi:hypothetical protein
MEINGDKENFSILNMQNRKLIRNCRTSDNNTAFCPGVAS